MSCNSDLKGTRPVPLGQLPSRQGLVPNPDPVAASRDSSPSAAPAGPGLNAGASVPTAGAAWQQGVLGGVTSSRDVLWCTPFSCASALALPYGSGAACLCCGAAPCSRARQHHSCCWAQPAAALSLHVCLFTAVIAASSGMAAPAVPLVVQSGHSLCTPWVCTMSLVQRITCCAATAGEMRRLQREAGVREQHSPHSMAEGSPPRSILDYKASTSNAGQEQQGQVCLPWSCALALLAAQKAGYLPQEH